MREWENAWFEGPANANAKQNRGTSDENLTSPKPKNLGIPSLIHCPRGKFLSTILFSTL